MHSKQFNILDNENMKSVFIIAEAGVNHNGDIEIAKKLVDVAVEAKVDAIKFQTFKAELGLSKSAKKAEYQITNTEDSRDTQYEMVKKLRYTCYSQVLR